MQSSQFRILWFSLLKGKDWGGTHNAPRVGVTKDNREFSIGSEFAYSIFSIPGPGFFGGSGNHVIILISLKIHRCAK